MKIAVTSQNRKTITEHAGRCRKFWVFDIENNRVVDRTLIELPKDQSFHESHSHTPHPLDHVDVLIAGNMGKGLVRRLASKGVKGLVTRETDPEHAVMLYLDGALECVLPNEHEHHHGHA